VFPAGIGVRPALSCTGDEAGKLLPGENQPCRYRLSGWVWFACHSVVFSPVDDEQDVEALP
jgi:hypothetical protein